MATTSERTAAEVARAYFEAIEQGDRGAQQWAYADDATVSMQGVMQDAGKADIVGFFAEVWGAIPDFSFRIVDLVTEGDVAVCHWHMTGTFAGPGTWQGIEPTGARFDLRGADVVRVRGEQLVRNDVYTDNLTIARQIGMVPEAGSPGDVRMTKAFNLRTRVATKVGGSRPEQVAEGVWVVRGGFPAKTMNVYLVRDGDGVLAFDAGIRAMRHAVATAAAQLGGMTRIVLGHGHQDHRGVAPFLGVPVLCHPDDVAITEGDGGFSSFDFTKLNPVGRRVMPLLLKSWDGGPVQVAGTVSEGDDVAGFRVVHLPGHAAGLIGLWRESDRLALTSDCFYTLDPQTGKHGAPRVPHAAFNLDTEQARASIRKLAALEPAAAWAGHADPVTGDVRAQLEHAAATT